MAYVFDMETSAPEIHGLIQGLLAPEPQEDKPIQPLSLLTEQPVIPEQPPLEPPEQRGGTAMVNAAMEKGNVAPQTPNPYALSMKRDIVQAKKNYSDAKTDEQQTAAQYQANFLRDVANAAGIDLSGYGSDVSPEDAYKNLVSQQARDIMEGTQRYYAMNSDRYRDKIFDEAIARGLSPRRANKLADSQAKRYQADRVQYLDGLLNSYGREGLVMTEYGNQILGELAHEDPMLAGFYAGIYPNAKEAYTTATGIAKEAAKHGYALDLLGAGHKNDLERLGVTAQLEQETHAANKAVDFAFSEKGKDNDVPRNIAEYREKAKIDADKLIQIAYEETKLDFSKFKWKADFMAALKKSEPSAIRKMYDQWVEYGTMLGLQGDELHKFGVDGVGTNLARALEDKGNGKGNDSSNSLKLNDLISLRNSYVNELKDLTKSDSLGLEEIDEEKQKEINQKKAYLAILDEQINQIKGTNNIEFKFQGRDHEQEDLTLINDIWNTYKGKYTDEQIKQVVYKKVKSATGDEEYAKRLAGIGMN